MPSLAWDRKSIVSFALRLALAWAALTALVAVFHTSIFLVGADAVSVLVESLLPHFHVTLSAGEPQAGAGDVAIMFYATFPVSIDAFRYVKTEVPIAESINAVHDLMPLVLLGSLVFAWPVPGFTRRLVMVAAAAVLGAAFTAWAAAIHIAGLFELSLQRVAAGDHLARPEPLFLKEMLFLEGGGLWAVPIALGVLLGLGQAAWRPRLKARG